MTPFSTSSRPRKRLSFEQRLLLAALMIGLPATVTTLILMLVGDYSLTSVALVMTSLLITLYALAAAMRRRVTYPLRTVSNLLESLRENDYSQRGRELKDGDALTELVVEINALSGKLREQRFEQLEATVLLGKIVEELDAAIFAFDSGHRLMLTNPAGEQLMGESFTRMSGRSAADLELEDCLTDSPDSIRTRSFATGAGRWKIQYRQFRQGGTPHHLLVISDLSRALRQEERQAWQRLIRVLGHELNNSLAPIKSMAETLARLLQREPRPADWEEDAAEGLGMIGDRAASLSRFMSAYSRLARLPPPETRPVRLRALIAHIANLDPDVAVQVEPGPEVEMELDPDQIEQVLLNLIKNAVEASATGSPVLIRWHANAQRVFIDVVDEGPGISNSANLFTPFFTTKPSGSGIGLVLCRQILEAHHGALHLRNREDRKGCVARVVLPRESSAATV